MISSNALQFACITFIIGVQGQMIGALHASFPSSCLSLPSHYLPAMALLLEAPHYPFAVLVFGHLQLSPDSYYGTLDGYHYNSDI
jgi:hypothetical protein